MEELGSDPSFEIADSSLNRHRLEALFEEIEGQFPESGGKRHKVYWYYNWAIHYARDVMGRGIPFDPAILEASLRGTEEGKFDERIFRNVCLEIRKLLGHP